MKNVISIKLLFQTIIAEFLFLFLFLNENKNKNKNVPSSNPKPLKKSENENIRSLHVYSFKLNSVYQI